MRKPAFLRCLTTCACFLFWLVAAADIPAAVKLEVKPDRKTALYEVGETATFTVLVTDNGQPVSRGSLSYVVNNFLDTLVPRTKVDLSEKGTTIQLGSKKAQFFSCVVTFSPSEGKPVRAASTVGFSVNKITPGLSLPDDFDEFWTTQKKRLARKKMKATLTPVDSPDPQVESFDLQVTCLENAPVSGYFSRPHKPGEKNHPAILWVHGAGVRSSSLGNSVSGAREGMLSLDINAHGLPNGKPKDFYTAQSRGPLANYRFAGRESRETIYFRGMYLRIVRAIDFLTSQPHWDGKNVIVMGHSQGGGQALVAGGIDQRVTAIAAGVPALCDHGGRESRQINGWPKIVPYDRNGRADTKVLQASRYIDAVNFASRCKAKAIMSVGFADTVCPPSSCYAAFNLLRGQKSIINEPAMGHAAPAHIKKAFLEFAKRSLK
ncbi:MAG: acetylxylan esterase [Planctomycetaceae bacterium]|nr:acetylxylan esterase [Planctomycetaceae bacterium]